MVVEGVRGWIVNCLEIEEEACLYQRSRTNNCKGCYDVLVIVLRRNEEGYMCLVVVLTD